MTRQLALWCSVVMLGLLLGACRAVPPLATTHASSDALGEAVLEALARGDRGALEALALSEQEFRDHVWPYLPAARPERNVPVSYLWGELRQKSAGRLTETLARHGGRRYQLVAVAFDGETDYGAYRIHRDATLRVRDRSGATRDIRVCGSMLEKAGAWKVFSYAIDE